MNTVSFFIRSPLFFLLVHIFSTQSVCCQESLLISFNEVSQKREWNKQELFQLSMFLKFLYYESHFGYVLLGDKPMAMESIPRHEKITREWYKSVTTFNRMIKLFNIDRGREIFNKVVYPEGDGFFYFEEKREEGTDVYVLNIQAFIRVVEKNKKAFIIDNSKDTSVEKFVCLYCGDSKFRAKINRNPYLLGILLGYGEKNARLYDSKRNINKNHLLSSKVKFKKVRDLHCSSCIDHSNMTSSYSLPIPLPGFAGNISDPETQQIVSSFRKSRKKLFSCLLRERFYF